MKIFQLLLTLVFNVKNDTLVVDYKENQEYFNNRVESHNSRRLLPFTSIALNDNTDIPNTKYETFIQLLWLFKYTDDENTSREIPCKNKYQKLRLIPDQNYDRVIVPNVLYDKFKFFQRNKYYTNTLVKEDITYNNKKITSYLYKRSPLTYNKQNNYYHKNIFKVNYDQTKVDNLANEEKLELCYTINETFYFLPINVVDVSAAPYTFSNGKKYSGVLGIAPSSIFWQWGYNVYIKDVTNNSSIKDSLSQSIHYQKKDPENDYLHRLATGKYPNFTGFSINATNGAQTQTYFDVTHLVLQYNKWLLDNVAIDSIGLDNSISNAIVCFSMNNDELILINNPDNLINKFKNYTPSNKETIFMTITFNNNFSIKLKKEHFVSNNKGKDLFWVGDLNNLKSNNICPSNTSIAFGKRFMRYVEITLEKNLKDESYRIGLGYFKEYKNLSDTISLIMIYSSSALLFQFVVMFVINCVRNKDPRFIEYFPTFIKKENTEDLEQETSTINMVQKDYRKSSTYIKYVELAREKRIAWIQNSKYIATTWVSAVWSFIALALILNWPDIYLGVLTTTMAGLVYMFLSILGIIMLCKYKVRFIDPYHHHYYLRNMLLFIFKTILISYILWDMCYPNVNSAFLVDITFLPMFFIFTIWNYIIFKNKFKKWHFQNFMCKDILEDLCIYMQWLHYQQFISAPVGVICFELWCLFYSFERCYCNDSVWLYSTELIDGEKAPKGAFMWSQGCGLRWLIVVVAIVSDSPMYDSLYRAFVACSTLHIIFTFCYCCFGYCDNGVSPLCIFYKRWWQVTAFSFDCADVAKEFDDKFLQNDKQDTNLDEENCLKSFKIDCNLSNCKKIDNDIAYADEDRKKTIIRAPDAIYPLWDQVFVTEDKEVNEDIENRHKKIRQSYLGYMHLGCDGEVRRWTNRISTFSYQENLHEEQNNIDANGNEQDQVELDALDCLNPFQHIFDENRPDQFIQNINPTEVEPETPKFIGADEQPEVELTQLNNLDNQNLTINPQVVKVDTRNISIDLSFQEKNQELTDNWKLPMDNQINNKIFNGDNDSISEISIRSIKDCSNKSKFHEKGEDCVIHEKKNLKSENSVSMLQDEAFYHKVKKQTDFITDNNTSLIKDTNIGELSQQPSLIKDQSINLQVKNESQHDFEKIIEMPPENTLLIKDNLYIEQTDKQLSQEVLQPTSKILVVNTDSKKNPTITDNNQLNNNNDVNSEIPNINQNNDVEANINENNDEIVENVLVEVPTINTLVDFPDIVGGDYIQNIDDLEIGEEYDITFENKKKVLTIFNHRLQKKIKQIKLEYKQSSISKIYGDNSNRFVYQLKDLYGETAWINESMILIDLRTGLVYKHYWLNPDHSWESIDESLHKKTQKKTRFLYYQEKSKEFLVMHIENTESEEPTIEFKILKLNGTSLSEKNFIFKELQDIKIMKAHQKINESFLKDENFIYLMLTTNEGIQIFIFDKQSLNFIEKYILNKNLKNDKLFKGSQLERFNENRFKAFKWETYRQVVLLEFTIRFEDDNKRNKKAINMQIN